MSGEAVAPASRPWLIRMLVKIKALHQESDGVLGAPRIWQELQYEGLRCGINRVARLMRANNLQGIPQKKRWKK